MSDSLVWQPPKTQPACLEPRWNLIGEVQSFVTDRRPADWRRQYLWIVALIKVSHRRFVNSHCSGSLHQRPGPAGLNYSSVALVWFTASSRCLDWCWGPLWQAPPSLLFHLPPLCASPSTCHANLPRYFSFFTWCSLFTRPHYFLDPASASSPSPHTP